MSSPAVASDAPLSVPGCARARGSPAVRRGFSHTTVFTVGRNRLCGLQQKTTLQQETQNRQQHPEKDLRRLPPEHDVVYPHHAYIADVPVQTITHRRLEISGSVQHPPRNTAWGGKPLQRDDCERLLGVLPQRNLPLSLQHIHRAPYGGVREQRRFFFQI